jgi:hypothetical protein
MDGGAGTPLALMHSIHFSRIRGRESVRSLSVCRSQIYALEARHAALGMTGAPLALHGCLEWGAWVIAGLLLRPERVWALEWYFVIVVLLMHRRVTYICTYYAWC